MNGSDKNKTHFNFVESSIRKQYLIDLIELSSFFFWKKNFSQMNITNDKQNKNTVKNTCLFQLFTENVYTLNAQSIKHPFIRRFEPISLLLAIWVQIHFHQQSFLIQICFSAYSFDLFSSICLFMSYKQFCFYANSFVLLNIRVRICGMNFTCYLF